MSCMFVRYHFGLTIVYVFALNHGTIIPISLHLKRCNLGSYFCARIGLSRF